jgi:hypothetical protein
MPTLDKTSLLSAISPPLDPVLAEQLLNEFQSLEKRFILRDWEPATLDGGQLTEAASRIIYHQDSGKLNRTYSVHDCLKYVEDPANGNSHSFPSRKSALHICKLLRTIYKFRSDRGAVHINPEYTANHLDSKLVLEGARWILSEILRLFWNGDRSLVADAIRQIVQFDAPIIGDYEGNLLVQRTDCTTEEEILILLHHAGVDGLPRSDIARFVKKHQSSVTRALTILCSSGTREVIRLNNGNYRLTDLGIRRVIMTLAPKLIF